MKARTVLITGAAGRLGQAVAAVFGERGARLVRLDCDATALHRAFGGAADAILLPVDLMDREGLQRSLPPALARSGCLDAESMGAYCAA